MANNVAVLLLVSILLHSLHHSFGLRQAKAAGWQGRRPTHSTENKLEKMEPPSGKHFSWKTGWQKGRRVTVLSIEPDPPRDRRSVLRRITGAANIRHHHHNKNEDDNDRHNNNNKIKEHHQKEGKHHSKNHQKHRYLEKSSLDEMEEGLSLNEDANLYSFHDNLYLRAYLEGAANSHHSKKSNLKNRSRERKSQNSQLSSLGSEIWGKEEAEEEQNWIGKRGRKRDRKRRDGGEVERNRERVRRRRDKRKGRIQERRERRRQRRRDRRRGKGETERRSRERRPHSGSSRRGRSREQNSASREERRRIRAERRKRRKERRLKRKSRRNGGGKEGRSIDTQFEGENISLLLGSNACQYRDLVECALRTGLVQTTMESRPADTIPRCLQRKSFLSCMEEQRSNRTSCSPTEQTRGDLQGLRKHIRATMFTNSSCIIAESITG